MEDYERRRLVCNARRRIQMTTLPEKNLINLHEEE
jgi:hypothetical protein